MSLVAGLDGCKGGWVGIALRDGRFQGAARASTAAETVDILGGEQLELIGIDIPIGLPAMDEGTRECDRATRGLLRGRASSVFDAPPRELIEQASYREANELSWRARGRGLSAQSYRLGVKILEVEQWSAAVRAGGQAVLEVHPELSFAAMNGGQAVPLSKRSFGGVLKRIELLERHGVELVVPEHAAAARAGVDDVLDAGAVAWSAARLARGDGRSVPDEGATGPLIHF